MSAPATEVLLAAGYALVLLVGALGLEALARHSHRRSNRYRTAGFAFEPDHDHWLCPEGERLTRAEVDHRLRIVRYRARAHVCNACPAKAGCTDSDHGREIAQPMDPWPHSEAGRFHRGVSVVMVALGALILVVALARNHAPTDVVVGMLALAPIGVALPRMLSAFAHTPSGFPDAMRGQPEVR
jgi:hypothetical protein